MTTRHRTIEQIIEDQVRRWELSRAEARRQQEEALPPRRPVIALSRLPGARGGEVATALAQQLGLDVFDREILHQVAESAHLSDQVVAALDERGRSTLSDWLSALRSDYISPYGYLLHLTQAIGAIARHGGAVILGHGAHLILSPGDALRVLVVAPQPDRIATLAAREKISDREAQRRLATIEAEQRAFVIKHFHAEFTDPAAFDLVVNTRVLGVAGAVSAIRSALETLPAPSVQPVSADRDAAHPAGLTS